MAYQQLPPNVPVNVEQATQVQSLGRKAAIGCGTVWLLLVLATTLPALSQGTFVFFFSLPFWAVGIGMLVWGLAPSIRALKLTPPNIDVSRDAVCLGESFDFSYHQVFKDRLEVDFAKVVFVMRETAQYRRGTDTYTETHEIPVEEKVLPGRPYQAGENLDLSHRFTVPSDGMHTFIATHNRIEWLIRVKVSIARWPDVDETYPIRVLARQFRPKSSEDR